MAHIPLNSKDPDELTLRVARLLAQADHVWHTNDVPRAILDRARADAPRTVCTRPPGEGEETAGGVFLFNMIRPEADTDRS
jgi:uroporphyrin-III C-methyltransferase/precorrin-2 dehydrogenase/sirohydrochlorin ferrochelatase